MGHPLSIVLPHRSFVSYAWFVHTFMGQARGSFVAHARGAHDFMGLAHGPSGVTHELMVLPHGSPVGHR